MNLLPLKSDTILLADDEPYNLQWVVDWLDSLKYKVVIAETVDAGIRFLETARFRTVIADLSIPLDSPQLTLDGKSPLYLTYPGLVLADFARNHDHTARQVLVYSVHDDLLVRAYSEKFGFTYLLKGRPRSLKQEIEAVLRLHDPRKG